MHSATPSLRSIVTPRLQLVCGTLEMAHAEIEDLDKFATLLDAPRPQVWPPPLNDEQSQRYLLNMIEKHGPGWSNWYMVRTGEREIVGNIGFKGGPSEDGTVEIGYAVLEAHQRKGYASEAASALLDWAFSHGQVTRVIAHTFPDLRPSIGVLEKSGFRLVGPGFEEPGTILFEFTRLMYKAPV